MLRNTTLGKPFMSCPISSSRGTKKKKKARKKRKEKKKAERKALVNMHMPDVVSLLRSFKY